jgi:ABC-type taurine transport system ATPase subunit
MITRLTLRNFKCIREQTYEFTNFDLLVGRNNCGKSTILQALAIWQFCLDEFRRSERKGSTGTQVVLPNFTALPVPEFILLWTDKAERSYLKGADGKPKQVFTLIEIEVTWRTRAREDYSFGVKLRYMAPQSVSAIPDGGWKRFRELDEKGVFPTVAYVPPFSGLEDVEKWQDLGALQQQIGKAQPGSVLRNLLVRVFDPALRTLAVGKPTEDEIQRAKQDWAELQAQVKQWFGVALQAPVYQPGVSTRIACEYCQAAPERGGRADASFDLITAGSGFHQTLILLAFLYGFHPGTILLDEPDAHLHVNLQREVLDYFKAKAEQNGVQFLIATHAEELVRGVDSSQIVSLVSGQPERVESTPQVLAAMAEVSNQEIAQLLTSPFILYLEGATDERILRAWARVLGHEGILRKLCLRVMGGGNKEEMNKEADRHFSGVRAIVKEARRVLLLDYDSEETYHPEPGNPSLYEWGRRNIENYLLVPDVWVRAATSGELFHEPAREAILAFFRGENLSLPAGQDWRTTQANIFKLLNGKKLLFESEDSLFHRLRKCDTPVVLPREAVAAAMQPEEIHEDVHDFFAKLQKVIA